MFSEILQVGYQNGEGVVFWKNKYISEAHLGLRFSKGHLMSQSLVPRPEKYTELRLQPKMQSQTTIQGGLALYTFGAEMEIMIPIFKEKKKILMVQ